MKLFICPDSSIFNSNISIFRPSLFTLLMALLCSSAQAAFVSPSWQRGSEGSAYLEWDIFAGRVNTHPDVGSNHIAASVLTEQIGQSFVTSSGNLYSFSSPQSYSLSVSTDTHGPSPIAQNVQVQLQIRTLSFEIDDRLVTLNGSAGDVSLLSTGLAAHPVFGTYTQYEYLFNWTVAASSVYQFSWQFDQLSTSLDAIVLDIFGTTDGRLPYPSLPILAAIPGSNLFNGQQLTAGDFPGTAQSLAAVARANTSQVPVSVSQVPLVPVDVSQVPVPTSAPLMVSALLGLIGLKRKSVTAPR